MVRKLEVTDRTQFTALLEVFLGNRDEREQLPGPWRIARTVGDLGYAAELVAINDETGVVIPWSRIARLYTSLTPLPTTPQARITRG